MNLKEVFIKYSNILKDKGFHSPDLDVELILFHVLDMNRSQFINNLDRVLTNHEFDKFLVLFKRRYKHEPIAYIFGYKYFCGFKFLVNKNVLIPRPITEELVDLAFNRIKERIDKIIKMSHDNDIYLTNSFKTINVIDIGTGSGCIITSLVKRIQLLKSHSSGIKINFFASDISKQALDVAIKNAESLGVRGDITFLKKNMFIDSFRYDFVITNLPYVDKKTVDFKNALHTDIKFEPKTALYARDSGMHLVKKVLKLFLKYKNNKDSEILLEIEKGQFERIANKFYKQYDFKSYHDGRIILCKFEDGKAGISL